MQANDLQGTEGFSDNLSVNTDNKQPDNRFVFGYRVFWLSDFWCCEGFGNWVQLFHRSPIPAFASFLDWVWCVIFPTPYPLTEKVVKEEDVCLGVKLRYYKFGYADTGELRKNLDY